MNALTTAQRALADAMSDVSELAYCAGWLDGTEYEVWRLLHEDGGRWGQAAPKNLAPLLDAVLTARHAAKGCWIVWDDTAGGEQAIGIRAWLDMYAQWAQGRRDATEAIVVWLRFTMDAARQRAEAASAEAGAPDWEYQAIGVLDAVGPQGGSVAHGSQDFLEPAVGTFMAAHDPAAVLRRIDQDRNLLEDLLAEKHTVACDPAYTCAAATNERDDGQNYQQGPCDCGLDERTARRVRLLANAYEYGWTPKRATS